VHTCFLFANSTTWLSRGLEINDPDFSGTERPANMNKQQWARFQSEKHRRGDTTSSNSAGKRGETPLEKMQDVARKCGFNFDRHLQILLDALNHYAATETVVLLGLCARLSMAKQGTESSGVSRTNEEAIL
jgi:gamma-tubulin complex component 2